MHVCVCACVCAEGGMCVCVCGAVCWGGGTKTGLRWEVDPKRPLPGNPQPHSRTMLGVVVMCVCVWEDSVYVCERAGRGKKKRMCVCIWGICVGGRGREGTGWMFKVHPNRPLPGKPQPNSRAILECSVCVCVCV